MVEADWFVYGFSIACNIWLLALVIYLTWFRSARPPQPEEPKRWEAVGPAPFTPKVTRPVGEWTKHPKPIPPPPPPKK